ncbi:hypothetical protein DL93DRAFT_2131210 [Clavulina sp. PMI_390]|nr:hypothetical protein DL93DRAFT_2131210 [Clavulina sp. PMI_390]
MLASLLNAGGLNLTKLDHVRTMALPKSSRQKDILRPLWALGMLLYVVSQLIGSSLALEYMRAEYVAPLGSSSLVFNFMFASILIGTPITRRDIQGTVVVILGVIGIVAFGSINKGLKEYFSLALLSSLWSRGRWIAYFILMTTAIVVQYISNTQLEAVYHARSEISVLPSHATPRARTAIPSGKVGLTWFRVSQMWSVAMAKLRDWMENWTASKDDKTIAWILGIGWACNGGAMAGGSLVFAKATVKLISGSLNHTNPGNQFVHPAAFFTFLFLALSAIFQIICLNRGLKIYDSTLVVPTFYAVYTATGWLNSLVFMDEVSAYSNWILFAIFLSICILISGVVLLTSKKPEPSAPQPNQPGGNARRKQMQSISSSSPMLDGEEEYGDEEDDELHPTGNSGGKEGDEEHQMWQIGDDEDDDDDAATIKHDSGGSGAASTSRSRTPSTSSVRAAEHPEQRPLKADSDDMDDEEFGEWEDGGKS